MRSFALFLFCLCWGYAEVFGQQPNAPNILLIVADDLGYEKLGAYGGINVSTPHLDQMAKEGMKFDRVYTSPVCTPSRMSLYTGQYAHQHGYTSVLPVHEGSREAVDFENTYPTYAQYLQAAGYYTAVTGKWQMAALEYHPEHCKSAGFDSWCVWQIWKDGSKTKRYWDATYNLDGSIVPADSSVFGPDLMADYVIDVMKKAKAKGQPFCIQHNMVLPHVPIVHTPEERRTQAKPSLDLMITYMDKIAGQLIASVEQQNMLDNTYIIFVGDNGTQSKTTRPTIAGAVSGGKWELNEGGMHVPLLITGPGIKAGSTYSGLVDMVDLFPTLFDIAKVDIPKAININGQSFFPVLTGKEMTKRPWVTGGINANFAVFDGKWRLDHQNEKLVDCRALPKEQAADENDPAAKAARAKLLPILNKLRAQSRIGTKQNY